jgi:ribosomal protein L7/L12
MNISPGSKGWITKYLDMLQREELELRVFNPKNIDIEHFTHLRLARSGIVFGFAERLLFAKETDTTKWTNSEKLRFLLFEALILIYLVEKKEEKLNQSEFIKALVDFYGKHNLYSMTSLFTFFMKESEEERLEKILAKRTEVKSNPLENTFWFNHMSNSFLYLDLILFQEYIRTNQKLQHSNYNQLALKALHTIALAAHSDGLIDEGEKKIYEHFLNAAHLHDEYKELAKNFIQEPGNLSSMSVKGTSTLFRRFLLDISILTIYANKEAIVEELDFLNDLLDHLKLLQEDLEENFALVESIILHKTDDIPFLSKSKSYEQIYTSMSNRWVKVLSRNKDKLGKELKESKELVALIKKSTHQELSKEEKERVKTQFLDIVKSMPALAIFMLPGGALLLPIVLKIIPDLIPSAFRDNEIEE